MILHNMKVAHKLTVLILITSIALGVVGWTGFRYMNQMVQKTELINTESTLSLECLEQIQTNNRTMDSYSLELLITKDDTLRKALIDKMGALFNTNNLLLEEYAKTNLNSTQIEKLNTYREGVVYLQKLRQKTIDLASLNKNEESYLIYKNVVKVKQDEVNKLAEELQAVDKDKEKLLNEQNNQDVHEATIIMFGLILVSIIVCVFIGLFITRMIVGPVRELQSLMRKAEKGDFTINGKYRSKDEMGILIESFNKMIHGLKGMIRTVNETSILIAASSAQLTANAQQSRNANERISSTIQEMAIGADSQVQSINHSSQVIEEMLVNAEQMASNAQTVSTTALTASKTSLNGNQVIEQAVQQIDSINHTVSGLSQAIQGLGERSREIGEISDLITGIAEQTNLLSLNAAIEAARAGQHGRGFAIVADEVRKLAEQSASLAKKISQLISFIQEDTTQTMQSMETATQEVKEGIQVIHNAGVSFHQIYVAVDRASEEIEEVAATIKQLSQGTEQVASAVQTVLEVAEQTASAAQNISAATEEQMVSNDDIAVSACSLATTAEQLKNLIERFKIS